MLPESWAGVQLDEPLGESALLANEWSHQLCPPNHDDREGCDWYHASWQTLRLLGVFESIRSDDDFLLPVLARLIEDGARRFLVSGAADYALLARIRAAAGDRARELAVTVMDRCRTPLELNAWYAQRSGLRLETVQGDVLTHDAGADFDVICTHSFLCFFTAADRLSLLRRWHDALVPGGHILTAQRVRAGDLDPVIRYTDEQAQTLAKRARELALASPALGVDPDRAEQLAAGYARRHWTHLIGHADELSRAIQQAGFELSVFEPPPSSVPVPDSPGTPNARGSVRWRILARKPV